MRNGKLLAEDSPLQLLTIYGLETLEQVFLKLCIKDEKDSTTVSSSADQICQKPPLLHSWTGNTLPTADLQNGKNTRTWVSMDFT